MIQRNSGALIVATAILFSFSGPLWASGPERKAVAQEIDPRGCTWTESVAQVPFKGTDTRDQVRTQAIAKARQQNLDVLGVDIKSTLNMYQSEGANAHGQIIKDRLQMTRVGRIINEQIVEERMVDREKCAACEYQVRVRNCVKPRQEQHDKGFHVSLTLTGIGKDREKERTTFLHGEDIGVVVTATRDAYVYLYNVDEFGNIAKLFPNEDDRKNFLKFGERLRLPTGKIVGEKYQVRLADGHSSALEEMLVIVSKHELSGALTDPAHLGLVVADRHMTQEIQGGGFMTWMGKMLDSDEEWIDGQRFYEIRRP